MAENKKWTVPSRIADAIEKIEQQLVGSELNAFGVKEHRYVLRQMFQSFCLKQKLQVAVPALGKDGKAELENGKPKMVVTEQECWVMTPAGDKELAKFMAEESNFVCYASNAKKLLADSYPLLKVAKAEVEDYG